MKESLFDRWFYTARHPKTDMPYGSHLIYRVCDKDEDKFEEGCEILKAAFEGGYKAALPGKPMTEDELLQVVKNHVKGMANPETVRETIRALSASGVLHVEKVS